MTHFGRASGPSISKFSISILACLPQVLHGALSPHLLVKVRDAEHHVIGGTDELRDNNCIRRHMYQLLVNLAEPPPIALENTEEQWTFDPTEESIRWIRDFNKPGLPCPTEVGKRHSNL